MRCWRLPRCTISDATGLIVFTDEVELYVPPGRGVAHVLRIIREVLAFRPRRVRHEDRGRAGVSWPRCARRSLVFLISDFQDQGFESQLRITSRRHDLIAISLRDSREESLPDCGLMECEHPETGERWLLDTSDRALRESYATAAAVRAEDLRNRFRAARVDHLRIEAGTDYVRRLVAFLHAHGKKD